MTKHKHLHYIVDFIQKNPGITQQKLLQKLADFGSATTASALEVDLNILRNSYAINIEYSPETRGYQLNEESDADLKTFENFTKSQALNGILGDLLQNGANVWQVIDIDDQVPIMNISLIRDFVEAILDKKMVRIHYHKFFEKGLETYILKPHLIRQALKRWYLIAEDEADGIVKTFGMERIVDVTVLPKNFKPKTAEIKEKIHAVYGISRFNDATQKVVIETTKSQGKYWETLPVHRSQYIEYLPNDKCKIHFDIVINTELVQLLATQLQPIKIESPQSLKDAYRDFIKKKFESLP